MFGQSIPAGKTEKLLHLDPGTKIAEAYGKLPLSFEANQGQTDAAVKFLSRGSGYTLFLTSDEAVFSVHADKAKRSTLDRQPLGAQSEITTSEVVRMKLVKANPAAKVTGAEQLPGASNYFLGNDPAKWRSDVPTYAKVKYEGIYSGIDLVYYGNQRQLEYDFVVAPGADPHRIAFDLRGAKHILQSANGDLVLKTSEGEIRWLKPIVYQENDGRRQEIAAHYAIRDRNRVGFELAKYDPGKPLYIDPLVYSTYLGGQGHDYAYGIAIDGSGNAYITGYTDSVDFPVTPGAFQPKCAAISCATYGDVFVAKINASGSAVVYATYLGGRSRDYGYGIAVDSTGNAYITGQTNSNNFPVTPGAFQTASSGGAFVTKLNPTGSALVYSTYLGGSESGSGIALDNAGDAFVTGYTASANFPTMNPLQPSSGGGTDAFVSELNTSGSALVYSTYLGGSGADYAYGIVLDSLGNAYVTGSTSSTNFPTTSGAFQTACDAGGNCAAAAFVTKVNPAGSALVYSTYLSGDGVDYAYGIAIDSSDNAYITGRTTSNNFPTMNPLQPSNAGGDGDAFVSKLNSTGSALIYSTYLGGTGLDQAQAIAVDSSGNAYITGYTVSTKFPTLNPLQTYAGSSDAFVAKLNPEGSAFTYSTYLGGSSVEQGMAIAVDSADNAYVAGYTGSTNFPTVTPLQPANAGDVDIILVKFGTVFFRPTSLAFGNQTVGTTSAKQVATVTNTAHSALAIKSIAVTGANASDFTESNNCPTSLATGNSCTITVTFTPKATGARSATVSITDGASGSPQALPLTGAGVLPAVMFSPSSFNFGNQTVNTSSAPHVATLKNTGLGTLAIKSISVTGVNSADYAQTHNCGTSLAPGGSCTITVTFKPSAIGTRTAAVSVTDNAPASPQTLALTGVGVLPAVTFSPTSLTFSTQVVFTSSAAKVVTLKNTGLGVLSITGIAISGAFGQTHTCGTTLSSGSSCTISVTFSPKTIGTLTGAVSVTDNAPGSPQKVTLQGTGTYVQLSPTSLNFGNQPVGTKSLAQKITLSNKGSVAVSISSISVTGTNAADFAQTNTCGTSVAAGASCFITVTFKPSAAGSRSAAVSFSDNGGGSPQKVSLSGTGT